MNLVQAVEVCFKKYAISTGRAARSEYWYFTLFLFLLGLVTGIADVIVYGLDSQVQYISNITTLATLLPSIAVSIRRLHDVDRTGWWLLISLTVIGIIPLIYWNCKRGTQGDNRFGPDPLLAVY